MTYDMARNTAACIALALLSSAFISTLSAAELKLPPTLHTKQAPPELAYQSVDIPSATMPEVGNWAELNQRVQEIGGWMFYMQQDGAGQEHSEHQHDAHQHKHKHQHQHQHQHKPQSDLNPPAHEGHPL